MAIFKSPVQVLDSSGRAIGEGMAYVHTPRGLEVSQEAGGTISLGRWEPAEHEPVSLLLEDGRRLKIVVTQSALSDCSRNQILRFSTCWPPEGSDR
jgi:hypothetical protein